MKFNKPEGYPEMADTTDRSSIVKHLKEVSDYYQIKADAAKNMLQQLENSDIGPGQPAVHKEVGNCFVTKMWPKIKEGKIHCAITFNRKDNPQLDAIVGRRNSTTNHTVTLDELMPYNETSKILFEE